MRSYWNASGGGWRDNDWSRSDRDWNDNKGTEEEQSMHRKVPWYDGSPPPVSGGDSRGWNESPVSCSDWQSSDTRQQRPGSCSAWQSSNTRQQAPTNGSNSQSSNTWQRSQPAVAAAVNTNSPDTVDLSNKTIAHTNWGAHASQDTWHASERLKKWAWLDQPADTDMHEAIKAKAKAFKAKYSDQGAQSQAAAHAGGEQNDVRDTGGAPVAAQRWLNSEAMKHGIEKICWGALANEIAAAHANEYPPPDVSCGDVGAASRAHTNGRDAAFFKEYKVKVHYSKHNAALKYFREEAECGQLDETGGRRAFGVDTPLPIPRLLTNKSGGEDFLFELGEVAVAAWTWESLIANLDDASIDFVVNGTSTPDKSAVATSSHAAESRAGGTCDMTASGTEFDMIASVGADSTASWDEIQSDNQQPVHPTSPRTRTIVGCDLVMDTSRHDHKRHAAARKAWSRTQRGSPWPHDKPLYKWSFMIKRDDGTVCLLEPHRNDTKVDMYEGVPAMDLDVPRNGLGGWDFKGDYRRRISHHVTRTLRFDTKKSPPDARRDEKTISDEAYDVLAGN